MKLDTESEDALQRLVPEHLRVACRAYVEEKRPTGHFLLAVLTNNLYEAIGRGDDASLAGLKGIIQWFYNYTPGNCHGTLARVTEWLKIG